MFVAGFGLDALLFFVPYYHARVGGFLGIGAQQRSFSILELIQLTFANGREGQGLFSVLVFCSMIVFAVLGIKHARRWVFLSGACLSAFFLILALFRGASSGLEPYFLPRLLDFAASGMQLTGFWINPPTAEPVKYWTCAVCRAPVVRSDSSCRNCGTKIGWPS
jgi:hypothetical protein